MFDLNSCYDTTCSTATSWPHNRTANCPGKERPLESLTDREIAEETLYWLRQAGSALTQLQKGGIGSMMSGMMGNLFKGK